MAAERIFDPYQQQVIDISAGRHLVLAPPGCGKTDILSERVVHAALQGVPYSQMLCLTFTNRAAKGMAQRIAERTGDPVPDDLFVGNIHRYCSQMLFAEGIVSHSSAIIDESDVENIVQEELCKHLGIKSRTTELVRFQHALWQLTLGARGDEVLHDNLLAAGSLTKLCDILGMPATLDSLSTIYADIDGIMRRHDLLHDLPSANIMLLAKAYQQYKHDNDLLDYDDLLILAHHHLSTTPEHRRYNWVEVDEVQDLNPLQLTLIDLITTPDATVVYLGDRQQAIFSFIGAKLETLEHLGRLCSGNIHHLHNNYRSPRYLLDLQNDYAQQNLGLQQNVLPTTADSTVATTADLCLLDVGDATLEGYYTARFAQRYGQLVPEGRVAVLVSTNREADEVSQNMLAQGISHFKISGTDLFSTPTVRLLLAHLSVLADETVFIAWARLMWGLGVEPTYTATRNLMRDMRRAALLPTDFILYPQSSYLQQFVQAYEKHDLVVFDTETTGLDPLTDDIVQIAAIRVRHGQVVGKPFNIIVETDKPLPATVGGNPNPMLRLYAESRRYGRREALLMFARYCGGSILVGHNAAFDYNILRENMRRACPEVQLEQLCPLYLDTLKYIRLVRPRMRHYKLAYLIEALHLQGVNSHRADDDILATLSLLNFCHTVAVQKVAEQRLFMTSHTRQIECFRQRYADMYRRGSQMLRAEGYGIADELRYAYGVFTEHRYVEPVEKWPHLLHYVEADLVRTDIYTTFEAQLERYITDLCTTKEADLCGGSLQERFIISTVHKAKGLEFDAVIVYRVVDGNYPGHRSWTERQLAEDARRLFVAISRSRRMLMVVYDSYYGNTPHSLSPLIEKVKGHFTHLRRGVDGKIRKA